MVKELNKNMICLYDLKEAALSFDYNDPMVLYRRRIDDLDEQDLIVSYQQKVGNLKFLMHITKHILSVKHKDSQLVVRVFLKDLLNEKIEEGNYFNWQELRFILFLSNCIKDIKSTKEIKKILFRPSVKQSYLKYSIG